MSVQIDRVHTLAATRPVVNGQPFLQHARHVKLSSPESQPHDDRQSQLEQALKRSVTLVIWYRPNCDPIRLTHEISTFPLFSLSHYPSVVSDLELGSTSYMDTYNYLTGHWEQHLITTVRTIESEQRLLYKLRKSLLTGLADDECTGLAEELALQVKKKQAFAPTMHASLPPPHTSPSQLKRPLSDSPEGPSAKRFYFPDSYPTHVYIQPPMSYMLPTQTIPYAPPLASPPLNAHSPSRNGTETGEMTSPVNSPFHSPNMSLQSPVMPQTPLYTPNTPNTATRTPFPQHPHPPLKRWPNDYTVFEIAAGFRAMDAMVAQSPTATQKAAFERVFGCRYVKSTVCRHRGVYRKADAAVRNLFEAMGNDERAVWGEFVRRAEGRPSMGKGNVSGDEKGMSDGTSGAGQPGQNPQSVGMGQEQQGQTGSDSMITSMSHLTMQPGLQQSPNGHAPSYDPSLVESGAGLSDT
ncbi:hypothetical protein JVU11DRAFT_1148 [Chiua virens]|nr:hypothetical protein JVU11DRAFT_10219 [Chiua virens]KAG9316968.1 hypothetical protein JVU11DRAFT_1148 [Chiua virens]